MKSTDPEPQLSAEEKAIAELLKKHARPATAPEDFMRSLQSSGPPVVPFAVIAPKPVAKFRFIAASMAAAAAVVLVYLIIQPPTSLPREIAVEDKMAESMGQSAENPAPPQSPPTGAGVKPAPGMDGGFLYSTREVAVIRRGNGLPPVQLVAVNNVRVRQERESRKLSLESRLIPVVLEYH